jgi:hypothetical protein
MILEQVSKRLFTPFEGISFWPFNSVALPLGLELQQMLIPNQVIHETLTFEHRRQDF